MTYIDHLNSFNRWLESNALPGNAQLMYFRLLNVFNRAGWPESVQIDNRRLMTLADMRSEKTAILARDKLASAGLLHYEKGRKGRPNRYFLTDLPCNAYSRNDSIKGSISVSTNDRHIKNKNNNKTKNNLSSPKSYDIEELMALSKLRLPEHL